MTAADSSSSEPGMTAHHVNQEAAGVVPREAAVGTLVDGAGIEDVARSLGEAGIPAERLYFLHGEVGATLIENGGNFVSRLFDGELRTRPATALREGKTLLAVYGVDRDDVESVRRALVAAGVVNVHYFGRWTYS